MVLLAGVACVGTAGAQGLEFTPIIELTTTYSDNINLQPDIPGMFAEDEFVTQVNPAFTLQREEGRITTDVEYRMQNLFFARDSDRNTTFHQLSGVADAELVSERLFLGVDTTFVQSIIDATATIPSSNVADTENIGDVWAVSIGPTGEWAGDKTARDSNAWSTGKPCALWPSRICGALFRAGRASGSPGT